MRLNHASTFLVLSAAALLTSTAYAQQPPPPPPPDQPFGQPFGTQPAPGAPTDPAQPPPAGAQPAPGGFEAGASAQPGNFGGSFGASGGQFGGPPPGGAPPPPADGKKVDEWAERSESLMNQNALSGGTGMLRTSYAGSGAPGTFRVGFMFDWFTSSGFLCDQADRTPAGQPVTCSGQNRDDEASHVGGYFSLSATPFSFLEAYASIRTYANSNTEGSPQLLQVLGDTTFGVKGFTPARLLGPLSVGGELQLLLLNGTGDVGLSGGSTSALIRILSTLDLRKPGGKGFPLRANLNLGYKIDNSGVAVEDVEIARAAGFNDGRETTPISRVERFGLGINKVDSFQTYLGVEVPLSFVQPYLEYTIDFPVNRQNYECHVSRVSRGDVCLGLDDFSNPDAGGAGFAYIPSRFTIGAKVSPFKGNFRGLSAHAAFDIGVTGTSHFIEEVAPQAPWTLFLGMGYAFDVKEKPVEKAAPPPAPAPVIVAAPQNLVRGFVHEAGKQEGVANAIISFQGGVQPPVATGPDGRFLTRHLEPGGYTFDVVAPGFKPGTCAATVVAAPPPQAAPMQPGMPGSFTPPPAPAAGPTIVDADCPLEALPRTGNVLGTVKDSTGANVAGAVVTITDALGKEQKATADGTGTFRVDALPPGPINIKAEATGYMNNVSQSEIRANEDARTTLTMNKRPKNPLVKIQGNELKLGDKILFETDSAKILGQSSALLEEIADVLGKNPDITSVEIQGHTDNTGGREHNQRLSDARANAVRDWLVKAGVSASRVTAKGYGQERPIAPNVTEANKAKNRRVQFIITKK